MQVLPEKEAKAIASQIFDGLAYLNGPSRRIIHYDLKPANILFNQLGEVKITVSPCMPEPCQPQSPPFRLPLFPRFNLLCTQGLGSMCKKREEAFWLNNTCVY